jgi:16S rRNA (guanine966-N2)-methyltransferase
MTGVLLIWGLRVKKTALGTVRIISGTLKGSKLPVLDSDGLRPTSDRVRETLFNWIQHNIQGRVVLDLFAGSGALGFEAASRQASKVILLEREPAAAALLEESKQRLKIDNAVIIQSDSLAWLREHSGHSFDLVFIDPPYSSDLWPAIWPVLEPQMAEGGRVYLEHDVRRSVVLPEGFTLLKEGRTSQSRFMLVQWHKPPVG